MLRHIVMIKFKAKTDSDLASNKLKVMLIELKNTIDSLLDMEVGINISSKPSAYDIVLTADFNDDQGLNSYRVHPDHMSVLEYLKVVMEKATVVDYII
ncbi:MAG: Dabb family protein [Bacteroidetes bacterium]|nr:Dabb family protein [Bacteroidota bacterium]